MSLRNAERPVIIDCDPGIDDAIAIFLAAAAPELDILGITTVRGNNTVANCTRNAQYLATCAELNIPIAQGAEWPLLREPASLEATKIIHGKTGLGCLQTSGNLCGQKTGTALDFLIGTLQDATEQVTIIAIGPLTNLAILFLARPDLKKRIKEIVIMGGALLRAGNVNSSAEFNIYADPEAAKIVFESHIPITMVGLDATEKCLISDVFLSQIRSIGTTVPILVADLLHFYNENSKRHLNKAGGALHDALAVAILLEPDLVETRDIYVEVETQSPLTRGETVGDIHKTKGRDANTRVCIDANSEGLFELLLARFKTKWGR